jgi:hypothetical protein
MNFPGHILACGSYFSIPKDYFCDVLSDETASNFYSLPFHSTIKGNDLINIRCHISTLSHSANEEI